jgi:hypothetical protein
VREPLEPAVYLVVGYIDATLANRSVLNLGRGNDMGSGILWPDLIDNARIHNRAVRLPYVTHDWCRRIAASSAVGSCSVHILILAVDQPKPRSAQQARHKQFRFAYGAASAPLRSAS